MSSNYRNTAIIPWPNPYWRENPYQKLLYAAIQAEGISIPKTPLAFSFLKRYSKPDWLHLNWPERLYIDNNKRRQNKKLARTLETLRQFKRNGGRLCWTLHNKAPHDRTDLEFHQAAYQRLMDLCDLVHVHFPSAVDYVCSSYSVDKERVLVMPHGHYSDYYGPRLYKKQARKMLGLPSDAIVLLNFGCLRGYKGINSIVSAFRAVNNDKVNLLVAGKPEDDATRDCLLNESETNSRLYLLLRKIKDNEIAALFSSADAFVFPSQKFFTSGSVILALTYEIPVIGVPMNQLELFEGSSFFRAWRGGSIEELTSILNNLDDWLTTVNSDEFKAWKQQYEWKNLVGEFCARLRSC